MLHALIYLLSFVAALSPRETLDKHVAADGVVYATESILDGAFSARRDFTVVMLMTGEGAQVQCEFCDIIGPNFKTVASSYQNQLETQNSLEKRPLYFILADFSSCLKSFQKLGLEQIPNIGVWSPSVSNSDAKLGIQSKHSFISFKSNGDQVETIKNMLASLGFKVDIVKPFNWKNFAKFVATIAVIGVTAPFMWKQICRVWQAKQLWLAFALMTVVMFISGHMYNVTRGTPFLGHGANGPELIEHSFNSQFAVETQIVATLYAVLAFTTVGLIKYVPKMSDSKAQTVAAVFGAAVVFVVFSVFLQVFKDKMGGFSLTLLPIKLI